MAALGGGLAGAAGACGSFTFGLDIRLNHLHLAMVLQVLTLMVMPLTWCPEDNTINA